MPVGRLVCGRALETSALSQKYWEFNRAYATLTSTDSIIRTNKLYTGCGLVRAPVSLACPSALNTKAIFKI